MTQRTALLGAAGLTAFVLVLLGGLAAYLTQPAALAPVPAAPAGTGPAAPAALAPDREAAYQAALQEAQARLEEANRRLAQAAPAPTAPPPAAPAPPAAHAYAVSADQALLVALGSAPGAALNAPPELVRYQDHVAYEVRLDRGLIYVDATSGQVLYNGAAGSVLAAANGPGEPAQTGYDDDEHERAAGADDWNEHGDEAGDQAAGGDD